MEGNRMKIGNGMELPPFRSLNDFILDRARFEAPPFQDFPKWNNRIIANLLYYQCNYFLFFALILITFIFFNAQDFVLGSTALIGVLGVGYFSVSTEVYFLETRRDHPLFALGAIVLSAYYFIIMLHSVFAVIISVLFPIFIILCHASVRLRDFMSKVTQTAERVGLRTTVMGRLLSFLSLDVKA